MEKVITSERKIIFHKSNSWLCDINSDPLMRLSVSFASVDVGSEQGNQLHAWGWHYKREFCLSMPVGSEGISSLQWVGTLSEHLLHGRVVIEIWTTVL